jgi:DNA primase
MDYYNDLKMRNDILSVALELGYNGKKSGSCYQGDCPDHGSTQGTCLVIWPGIQGFRCYHCGKKGDVIDLVMLYKRLDHKGARDWLADRSGMHHLNEKHLSPEDQAKQEDEVKEKVLVEDILTEASHWYHEQLQRYPDILDHLLTHYGFSQEIIDQLQIGFSPPPRQENPHSELAEHLSSIPEFKENLVLSAFFTFKDPSGPLYDYFKGRIIFPYWKGGKVVYMAGRSTSHTPVDNYECYTTGEGQIKIDRDGNPQFIKYKKLRTHDPTDEKKKFISKFLQNDVFMGEDIVRGAKEVIITEGAPDWVSAIDKGFSALSILSTITKKIRQDIKEL